MESHPIFQLQMKKKIDKICTTDPTNIETETEFETVLGSSIEPQLATFSHRESVTESTYNCSYNENHISKSSEPNPCKCNADIKAFQYKLKVWSVENKITHSAFSKLLKILKNDLGLLLPNDSRTVMKTPKVLNIKNMDNGCYYHFGLQYMITTVIQYFHLDSEDALHLQINVDGLPLAKSSKSQFWPILGHIEESSSNYVFPIGIYHGNSKLNNCKAFLEEFIVEYKKIQQTGIVFKNKRIMIYLSKILCDAPVKSFILNVKSHNAYFGCTKCMTEEDFYHNRMTFPDLNASLRTVISEIMLMKSITGAFHLCSS